MPKRNNPFGDQSSLQLKTHIGEKEVDKGVCHQTRMQAVYERTQALLFKGMKQNSESDMAVDVNENHTSYPTAEPVSHSCENSSLRQLHLNRNCELVQVEEAESIEMETDFDMQRHKEKNLEQPSSFVFGAPAVEQWTLSPLPITFGFQFGRNSGALSPAKSGASCSEKNSPVKEEPLEQSCQNAFSLLMQGNKKHSGSSEKSRRACHNCRKPVAVRDVVKCQFCEEYICSGCMRQCQGCFLHYCQLCSIVNYDLVAERAFCLACSGR